MSTAHPTYLNLVPTVTFPTMGWPTQTECYPPGFQAASSVFNAFAGATSATFGGYFSPGACPARYTSACTADILFTSAGEQIALCCPRYPIRRLSCLVLRLTAFCSGYRCWALKGSCVSEFSKDNTVTFVSTSVVVGELGLPRLIHLTSSGTVTSYINSALAVPIQVRWAASDLASLNTTVPLALNTTVPSPGHMPAIGPAIYLSVGIPSVLIILTCVFFFIRIHRARKKAAAELSRLDIGMVEKAELGGECVLPQESGGIMRLELDAIVAVDVAGIPARTAELEAPIAELPAPFPELEAATSSAAAQVAEVLSTEATLARSAI